MRSSARASKPNLVADSATTEGIVRTLSREPLNGKDDPGSALRTGESGTLQTALQKQGATVIGVSIYSYTQASETRRLRTRQKRFFDKEIDAITFTSATQVPFLFRTADALVDPAKFRTSD